MSGLGAELVLASHNPHKLAEMQALLAPLGVRLRAVSEFCDQVPDENAASFVENALIKARHAARISGLPALADDSGLAVTALGGAPGVHSARYAGAHSSDATNNDKLLQQMRDLSTRDAQFVCVLALLRHADDPLPLIAHGLWQGQILDAPRGDHGFGYDPLFFVPDRGCSAAELSAADKNSLSHRARAAQALLAQLQG